MLLSISHQGSIRHHHKIQKTSGETSSCCHLISRRHTLHILFSGKSCWVVVIQLLRLRDSCPVKWWMWTLDVQWTLAKKACFKLAGDHIQYYRNKWVYSFTSPAMETCAAYLSHPPPPRPPLIPAAQQFSVLFPQTLGFELTDLIRDKVQAQAPWWSKIQRICTLILLAPAAYVITQYMRFSASHFPLGDLMTWGACTK